MDKRNSEPPQTTKTVIKIRSFSVSIHQLFSLLSEFTHNTEKTEPLPKQIIGLRADETIQKLPSKFQASLKLPDRKVLTGGSVDHHNQNSYRAIFRWVGHTNHIAQA
ncbi:hypothetical protein T265_09177 [Opisthorchis viverrini]|uniref:Uncharacterized protein n=1 Tax=Opisthorchis viverrini TaxID=6198 RepID=A0A074Z6U4_OPIVI|nr:hypothetical protein T265_09177 [Opisthorchis viverrini]KER22808.1 hypothetical protein T265_09177 [Opisthorchis viverrini]